MTKSYTPLFTPSELENIPHMENEVTLTSVTFHFIICIQDQEGAKYSGRGKFMPLPLKSKILETPGSLVTDDIKMFPL